MTSIAVLKFGSSVLRSAADLPVAVAEIDRWVARGERVIAVVSAYHGVTDARFEQARSLGDDLHAQAAYVAKGEEESSTALAAALVEYGVTARWLDADEIGLVADGAPHDSTPIAVTTWRLEAELQAHAALVVPGYVARDLSGRVVLLGRGGSDLTALFLAQQLAARCRLLKDVDGVYDSDPAALGNARRYDALAWSSALAIGGRVIQPRGLQFAQERGVRFEVSAVGAEVATVVGPGPDALAPVRA
jgi:homoserine dehydrogenase